MLTAVLAAASLASLPGAVRLHSAPSIWLHDGFLSNATVDHIVSKLPTGNESAWSPCIGQTQEFGSKRCTMLEVDAVVLAAIASIEKRWNVDASALRAHGLPVIRYLPGAPPVGVHGDIGAANNVPNETLVVYLTGAEPDDPKGGQTYFPDIGVAVTPRRGAVLSFANVDASGRPDPAARHGVSRVSRRARGDRLVVQVPLFFDRHTGRRVAAAEHVSGMKHSIHMGIMVALLVGFLLMPYIREWFGGADLHLTVLKAYGTDERI